MIKNLTTMLACLFVAFSQFSHANPQNTLQSPNQLSKQLFLNVYQKSGDDLTVLSHQQYSRSNPNHRLCWGTVGSLIHQAKVEEVFTSPASMQFIHPQAQIVRSVNGRQHRIISNFQNLLAGDIQQCWQFDHTDPIGQYQFQLYIDGVAFPVQTFEVIP